MNMIRAESANGIDQALAQNLYIMSNRAVFRLIFATNQNLLAQGMVVNLVLSTNDDSPMCMLEMNLFGARVFVWS